MRTLALLLAFTTASRLAAQDKPKERAEASAKKIKDLQKERIETMKAAADTSMKLAQNGRIELWEATEDVMSLLKVELEAAERKSDYITLYEKTIERLKLSEEIADARGFNDRRTFLAAQRIKARRLEVEILLEQAKSK